MRKSVIAVLALTMAALTLPAGCDGSLAGAATSATPNWGDGNPFGPNCSREKPVVVMQTDFDINGDGPRDWFAVFRCPKAAANGQGDRLEVATGEGDLGRPRPLGTVHPLIHPDDPSFRITVEPGACFMTKGRQLYIADRAADRRGNWHVAAIATWRTDHVELKPPSPAKTIPC
jgi:hypothetical protein